MVEVVCPNCGKVELVADIVETRLVFCSFCDTSFEVYPERRSQGLRVPVEGIHRARRRRVQPRRKEK